VRERAILEALEELERWQERERQLHDELRRAQAQAAYYQALVRDMKRDVQPARLGDLLRSL
jgi:Tfp pilus assembly protein PilO